MEKIDTASDDYFAHGQSWDQEICASLRLSKNRAWFISFFCMGIAALSMASLLCLLPLKTFAPYVISVEKNTGAIEILQGLENAGLSEDKAITQSYLVRYVSARESYNPSSLRENYDFAALLSRGEALDALRQLWSAQNKENPSLKWGKSASASIKIKSVSLLGPKTASVRFLREVREAGQTKISHWQAVLDFQYVQQPMKMAERFINPLGFKITRYTVNPEGLESIE